MSVPRAAHGRLNNERGTAYRVTLIKGHSDARGTRRIAAKEIREREHAKRYRCPLFNHSIYCIMLI